MNDISDHLPVFSISKPKLERKCTKKLLKIRMTNQENITSFKQELAKQTWENIYQAENVHEAYDVFMTKIVKLYNATCPVKNVTVKEHNNDKPWITTGLTKCMQKEKPVVLKILENLLHIFVTSLFCLELSLTK